MNFAPIRLILIVLFATLFSPAQAPAGNSEKVIRLRNERITTHPPSDAERQRPDSSPVNGLWLIQFESTPSAELRAELAALGVDLLSYVPEDAFIASITRVPAGKIRSLPGVRWLGPFRPEHKLEGRLALLSSRRNETGADLELSVLLAPRAPGAAVAQARSHFSRISGQSDLREGTILRGALPAGRLRQLAASPAVLWIEPAPQMKLNDEIATKIVAGDDGNKATLAAVHQLGYTGAGVTVAVADSGLDSGDTNSMHPDIAGRVTALFAYGAPNDAADYHSHGTHCAGIIAGDATVGETDDYGYLYGLGVAPGANLIGQRIFDGVGAYTYPNSGFEPLTRDAKLAGADIGSNSWGDDTQGRYDLSAMEFDALVRDAVNDVYAAGDQPYILEFSAGNAGPGQGTIGSPAVAKNVIATGAAQNSRPDLLIYADGPNALADFSSRGPCEDGRIKPDVTAPGTWIASLRSIYADDNNAWGDISEYYLYQGGTSQAGPHVAGAAALFVQYWRESHTNATPSPALVKAALINSAEDMDETAVTNALFAELFGDLLNADFPQEPNPVPNMDEGWGRVSLTSLIGSTRDYQFVDQSVLLTNDQDYEVRVLIGSADEPLKITLDYTDVPGSPVTVPALVNDLDLEVLAPNGHVYRGNQFVAGDSIEDPDHFDNINNVESVHLLAPPPGEYTIRVHARNVVMDARRDTGAIDQDFALVISGRFAPPGTGIVTFDRTTYTAPTTMHLRLVDYDLAGLPTSTLALSSSTESISESVTLHAYGTYGLFTGVVATATGPAVTDGQLQVQHGDTITAAFQDLVPAATRLATAQADLLPPVISGLLTSNRFGKAEIQWDTDEPASSIVLYGTNAALGLALTNGTFESSHVEVIPNQIAGLTYYFKVVCSDTAGNRSTNDNSGAPYQFVAPFAPAILIVDGTYEELLGIPLITDYTDALDALGLAYDVWNVDPTADGSPTLTDLQPYRVVLWRLPEASFSYPTLTPSEQTALTQYLNGGGGLFIASMEAVSRLDSYSGMSFRQNVLHVASYAADVSVSSVDEVPGDPIGDGVSFDTDYTTYGDFDASDTITPGTGATGILRDLSSGNFVGLSYPQVGLDSPGRVVYLSFPLDAVPTDTPAPGNRAALLRRVLVFLAPGLNGEGNVAFNQSAYSVPSQATIEVADSDLAGLGQISINVASDTQTSGLMLDMLETLRRGVFRGSLALVTSNSGSSLPELLVHPGDAVRATYFDTSLGAPIVAQVMVETNPPVIFNVTNEPSYLRAEIYWDTDELADSLVEFGESKLLGRTAYNSAPTETHAVTLPQLEANRTYYFRVISKDQAGNVAVDDNGGAFHTFTTLEPLHPPFVDHFEGSVSNWTVYTVEESERGWELGPPGTFLFPLPAHSLSNAWGSNLKLTDPASAIETYLISPAILLDGGNQASLDFWHTYDFTPQSEYDILEAGEVLLLTEDAVDPVALAVFSESAPDWEPVHIDLSPYAGRVVYLAWHYFLFSLDELPRTGWLLDDVSITTTNVLAGTIVVSNNLWQASYSLQGPSSHGGSGLIATYTNASPGDYIIAYGDVPFYQKPAAQTNTLTAGETVVFQGYYTFADANTNGISDAWEQAEFSVVSTNRTASTDTDGDGMTDHDESIAGTDPNDPVSFLSLDATMSSGNAVEFDWNAAAGRAYRLDSTSDLLNWTPVGDWQQTNSQTIIPAPGQSLQFRLEVVP